ncbi:hypothetical protein P7H60_11310 [Vagococcus carniphilus]|uniref:hypothetical protein n=1 Tax=Vagococcus carniphilus TaxID=218144 RepID=UPI0028905725|nr:hypothetical protein [Vagococcus carniphilus]MDT2849729.1 hypothetical protein [Vagococcus carniphilus]
MFKLMYVPKELRHLNYKELVNRQAKILAKTEEVLRESNEVKKENDKIQANLLLALGNLNKCSEEDLIIMQTIALNYMKVAINKESGKYNG